MGRLWPDLEPWERRARLAELGLTEPMLLAIAEADPELAPQLRAQRNREDAIRAVLRWYEQHPLREKLRSWSPMTGKAYEAPPRRPELALPRLERLPPLDDDGRLEPPVSKNRGGRPTVEVSKDTLLEILRQSLQRARSTAKRPKPTYQEIAANNGVERTWVTPIVKWAVKHPREAREAIRLSKTPPRFSTFVRD
jgi:hypothetical protein